MRRLIILAIVSVFTALPGTISSAYAAPTHTGTLSAPILSPLLVDGGRQRERLSEHNLKFAHHRHYPRLHFSFTIRSGHVYYRGHRGYRHARKGYVFYHGYYFPRHVIHRNVVHPRPVIRLTAAHVRWCYARYKTYRHHDNTYAYKVGKRTYCRSPYSH